MPEAEPSLREHLDDFLDYLHLNRHASDHTVAAYESDLAGFIEHLSATRAQCPQQPALARTGESAHRAPFEVRGKQREVRNHLPAIRAVAAIELRDAPAYLVHDVRERTAAAAAAPAVHQRPPRARPACEAILEMAGDIRAHERRADFLRFERGNLLVDRSDACTLFIAQHRTAYCAGNVVFGVLAFRAHIDDLVKLGKLCYGYERWAARKPRRRRRCGAGRRLTIVHAPDSWHSVRNPSHRVHVDHRECCPSLSENEQAF